MQFYYLDHSSSLLLWKWIFLRKQQRMRMQWRRKRLLLADSSSVILWRMQWRRKRMRRNLLIFVLKRVRQGAQPKAYAVSASLFAYKMLSFFCGFFFLDLTFHSLFTLHSVEHSVVSGILHHFINTVSINNQPLMHLFFLFLLLYSYRQAFFS